MTDLTRPVAGDPLSSSNGKASTVILDEAFDLIETNEDAIAARTSDSIVTPDSFAAGSLVVINSADSTTNWGTQFQLSGGGAAVDTVIKTEGTGSIKTALANTTGSAVLGKMYYNLAAPLDVTGRAVVMIDARWTHSGANNYADRWEAVIASGTALSGTVSVISMTGITESTWASVSIPTTGLTTIQSVGIRANAFVTASAGSGVFWWMDNLRLPAQSKLETAMNSATTIATVVPPDYAAEPFAQIEGATKSLLDLRPSSAVLGRHNGVRYSREWAIPEDGSVDVTSQMNAMVNELEDGDTLFLGANARYLMSAPWIASGLSDVTIDGEGATLFANAPRLGPQGGVDNSFLTIAGCANVTVRNLNMVGYRKDTFLGSALTTLTGSPSVSGSTVLLDAQNEEVRVPITTGADNYGTPWYFRDVNGDYVVEATLSDTNHVASDCQILIRDGTTAGATIGSSTLTLTGTPTVYRLAVDATKYLHSRLLITVKKLTATANVITVSNISPYGRVQYNVQTSESAHGINVTASKDTLIEDCNIEGIMADGITTEDPEVIGLTIRRCVSRGSSRQGMSFNQGQRIVVEDCDFFESGRSAIDLEPFTDTWFIRDVMFLNNRVWNTKSYAIAATNWARIFNLTFDGLDSQGTGAGCMIGGAQNGIYRNIISHSDAAGDQDWNFRGRNCQLENITCYRGFVAGTTANTFDDGTGVVSYAGGGNTVRNITITNPLMQTAVAISGCTVSNISLLNADTGTALTPGASPFGPISVGTDAALEYAGIDMGVFRVRYPNTYKGVAYAPGTIWMPGGYDHLQEPVVNTRSLGKTTTRGNNLSGIAVVVTAASPSATVTFPSKGAVATWSGWNAPVGAVGVGPLPLGTYYYRFGTKGLYGGPPVWQVQQTVVVSGVQNAVSFQLKGWARDGDAQIPGFSLLRGTVNGGPYTTRFDVSPTVPIGYATGGTQQNFADNGATLSTDLTTAIYGFAASYPAQSGSWTAVDESGYEPDTAYGVFVVPSWPTTVAITAKRTNGFDVSFGVPAPSTTGGTFDWFLVR